MPSDGHRDPTAGSDSGPAPPFPLKLNGKVIKGFGRGSKELGIPTANIPISGLTVGGNEDVESGVYFGWAGLSSSPATKANPPSPNSSYKLMQPSIYRQMNEALHGSSHTSTASSDGAVYPMCMSIGYNPYYNNTVRSVEVHIMQDFDRDFYESHMNLMILGFIRPELDYVSKEKLIEDIKTDIDVSGRSLAREAYVKLAGDGYLLDFRGASDVGS